MIFGFFFFICSLFFQCWQFTVLQFSQFVIVIFSLCISNLKFNFFNFCINILYFFNFLLFTFPLCLKRSFFLIKFCQFFFQCNKSIFRSLILFLFKCHFFNFKLHNTSCHFVKLCRHWINFSLYFCSRLVNQVNRFIRQKSVIYISVTHCSRCNYGIICNSDSMENFKFFFQST